MKKILLTLCFITSLMYESQLAAQPCNPLTPTFSINLTGFRTVSGQVLLLSDLDIAALQMGLTNVSSLTLPWILLLSVLHLILPVALCLQVPFITRLTADLPFQ